MIKNDSGTESALYSALLTFLETCHKKLQQEKLLHSKNNTALHTYCRTKWLSAFVCQLAPYQNNEGDSTDDDCGMQQIKQQSKFEDYFVRDSWTLWCSCWLSNFSFSLKGISCQSEKFIRWRACDKFESLKTSKKMYFVLFDLWPLKCSWLLKQPNVSIQ